MNKYIPFETKLEIDWIDSGCLQGWQDKDDIVDRIKRHDFHEGCKSVGYYIGEDDKLIFIALTISEISVCNLMYIPKISINKIQIITTRNKDEYCKK